MSQPPDETRAIEPALTPEEWDQWKRGERYIFGTSDTHMLNRRAFEGPRQHATMALANAALPDDDPRKITHGDVHNVEDAIGTIMMGVRVETLSVQGLWDLAAKLVALLPPEG